MISYLGQGERFYGQHPVLPNRREYWEFEAVLSGAIAPIIPGEVNTLQKSRIWVFPPGHLHGWMGAGADACEVLVIHSTRVCDALLRVIEGLGMASPHLSVPLSDASKRRLRSLYAELLAYQGEPGLLSALRQERAILDLALLVLEALPPGQLPSSRVQPRRLVERALAWCGEHLADGADVAGAARAVGLSPAHLRRLFHQEHGRDPRTALRELRLRRADDLLADPSLRLEAIAAACGFSDASALSRAYRARRGRPPRRPGGRRR